MLHGTVVDDLVGHALDEVRRNGEADADGTCRAGRACGGGDGRVDADHLAGRIKGRAAGVARVDGRVGDDGVVVVIGHGHRAVERGHDAGGGGVVVAERIADRHDGLADGEIVGIGEFRDFQIARRIVELDHGQIGGGVGADHLRGIDGAAGERHLNLLRAGNHVVIGGDIALVADHHAGALGFAVAGRHVDGHHGIGHFLGHRGPIDRRTGLRLGGTGTGRVGLDVGQRAGGRHMHPTVGDRGEADAEAQRAGHQCGHNGGDHMAGHAGLLLGDDRRLVRLVREALPRSAERIAVARSRRGHVRAVLRLLLIVLLRAVLRGRAAKRIAERIAIVPLIAGRIRVAESAEERRTVVLRLALLLRAVLRLLDGLAAGITSRRRRHRTVRAVFGRRTVLFGRRILRRVVDHRAFTGSGSIIRRIVSGIACRAIRRVHGRKGGGGLLARVRHCNRFGNGSLCFVGDVLARRLRRGLLRAILRLGDVLIAIIFSHCCSLFVSRHSTWSAIVPLELLSKSKDTCSGSFLNVC